MRTTDYEIKNDRSARDSPTSVERFEGFDPYLNKNSELLGSIGGFLDSSNPATRPTRIPIIRDTKMSGTNCFPLTAASRDGPKEMTIDEMDKSIDQYLTEKYNAYCQAMKNMNCLSETNYPSTSGSTLVEPTPEKGMIFQEEYQGAQSNFSSAPSQDYQSHRGVVDLDLLETEEDLVPIELARARSDDLLSFRPLLSFGVEFDEEEGILGSKEWDKKQTDKNSFVQYMSSLHHDDNPPRIQNLNSFNPDMVAAQKSHDYEMFDFDFENLNEQSTPFLVGAKPPPTQPSENHGQRAREEKLYTPSRRVSVEPHTVVSSNAGPHTVLGNHPKTTAVITPLKKRSENPKKKTKAIKALKKSKHKSKQAGVSSKPKSSRKTSPKTLSNKGIFGYVPKATVSSNPYDGENPEEEMENPSDDPRFRDYQVQNWTTRFQECKDFVQEHGHCYIPHDYPPNQVLSRWAKRQRYQYKLYKQGSTRTSMTPDRVRALEGLGFCWDAHKTLWEERYQELLEFVSINGHANVPTTYQKKPKLATWVKCQRRQYKVGTRITKERVKLLEDVGFKWEVKLGGGRK